jgi:hypothetical protein
MKTFPTAFAAQKNLPTGAAPIWIFKFTAGGVDYYVNDNAVPVAPWGITTVKWMQSWGEIKEGIGGTLDEFRIADCSLDLLTDPDASPNMESLVTTYAIEASAVARYLWFYGCPDVPQEMFRGYVRDINIPSETQVQLSLQDESLRLERAMIGTKVTLQAYPSADPDDVGKVIPIVFGTVHKLLALAINAGVQTSLPNAVNALSGSIVVSDVTGLSIGKRIQVDDERMDITGIAGSTLTVTRGVDGTISSAHQRGALIWEQKTEFIYAACDIPVASIPKVYCVVGQVKLDISMVCTVWPAGNHPNYPGKAVISVPGFITIQQAINLAIADGISVTNGTLDAVLAGNVTKIGSAVLAGAPALTGNVALSGFVALTGGINDPGHTHLTGQSSSENTTTGLPTAYDSYGPSALSFPSGFYGYPYPGYPCSGLNIAFPADGARSSASYSITLNFNITYNGFSLHIYTADGVLQYSNTLNIVSGSPFTCSFSTGSNASNNIYVLSSTYGAGQFQVTAASRTIQLTSLVSSANSASVSNGSLAASNNTLAASNTLGVSNNTLGVADGIGISNTLDPNITGNVLKTGTVSLTGNSVANTMVGDQILCDVVALATSIYDVYSWILTAAGYPGTFQQVGAWPAYYTYNGAITEYKSALYWLNDLAFQSRAWFKPSRGTAQLIYRPNVLTSVKTLASCRISGGKRVHSRKKTSYDEVLNTVSVLYNRDWSQTKDATAYQSVSTGSDAASIANYGPRERPELFQFDFVTDPAMAADLRDFYLAWYAVRHWLHEFETFLYDCELEFGDAVVLGFAGNAIGQILETKDAPGNSTKSDTIGMVVVV